MRNCRRSCVSFSRSEATSQITCLNSFQHDANDDVIFDFAKSASLIVVTKADDFVRRSDALGAPPQILWLRIGNCRNPALFAALASAWVNIVAALDRGERVVELRAR